MAADPARTAFAPVGGFGGRSTGPVGQFELPLAVLAGLGIGLLFAVASYFHIYIGVAAALALPGALVVVLRPQLGAYLFVLIMILLEEFPSGLGEVPERSLRTPFYSTSLGVPGLYATDVFLFGLIGLFAVHTLIRRDPPPLLLDRFGVALAALMGFAVLSSVISIMGGNPFAQGDIAGSTGTSYAVNQDGAKLIALFQFKNYSYLFFAYLLGLAFMRRPEHLQDVLRVFAVGIAGSIVVGFVRLGSNPRMVLEQIPLFYHSPTSWLFGLITFFVVLCWGRGLLGRRESLLLLGASAILMLFILISFRRTMWGAVFIGGILTILFADARARGSLIIAGGLMASVLGMLLILTPAGSSLIGSIMARLSQTTVDDPSTLYRLSLFIYFAQNFWELPLFGYGVTPLWNKVVYIGLFESNLENIHSLYFWLILRTGIIGFAGAVIVAIVIMTGLFEFIRRARNSQYQILGICVVLALVMLAFSGIFNPVYGETRYMILTGFALAMVSRMIRFEQQETMRT